MFRNTIKHKRKRQWQKSQQGGSIMKKFEASSLTNNNLPKKTKPESMTYKQLQPLSR